MNKLLAAAAVAGVLASSPGVGGELAHDEVSTALDLCERYTVSCGEGSPAYPRCYSLPACLVFRKRD